MVGRILPRNAEGEIGINNRSASVMAGIALIFTDFFCIYLLRYINAYQLLAVSAILVTLTVVVTHGLIYINRSKVNKTILSFIGAIGVTTVTSSNRGESIKYLLLWCVIYYLARVLKGNIRYKEFCYKWFFRLSLVECIFIIAQYLYPQQINRIMEIALTRSSFDAAIQAYNLHRACTGIAGSQPFAMMFAYFVMSIGIVQAIAKVNLKSVLTIIVGLISIVLSGKRSALVIVVMVILYTSLFVFSKDNRQKGKWRLAAFGVIFIAGLAVNYSETGLSMLAKNELLMETGDITNGRILLISAMLDIFKQHPIFGIGPLSTSSYYGDYLGHNIYLQTLAEMGIVGFVALISMLVVCLRNQIRVVKSDRSDEYEYLALFVQLFVIFYGLFGNPLFSYVFIIPYALFAVE